jgi:hypothetical protein
MIWEGCEINRLWPLLKYHIGIYVKWTKESHINSKDTRSPVREWSVGPISYITGVLGAVQGLSAILLHDVGAQDVC